MASRTSVKEGNTLMMLSRGGGEETLIMSVSQSSSGEQAELWSSSTEPLEAAGRTNEDPAK